MRESALNRIIQDRGCISYNVKACAIFDEINREKGWNGQHALHGGEKQVIGYSVDYYEPILNIVIEFDEKFHSKQIDKDISRQQKIIKYLGCKFYRIPYNQHWTNIIT